MPNYIERTNFTNVSASKSQQEMVTNLKNMINNVTIPHIIYGIFIKITFVTSERILKTMILIIKPKGILFPHK